MTPASAQAATALARAGGERSSTGRKPSGKVRAKVSMPVTLPLGHDLVPDPHHASGLGHQLHREPRRAVPQAFETSHNPLHGAAARAQ